MSFKITLKSVNIYNVKSSTAFHLVCVLCNYARHFSSAFLRPGVKIEFEYPGNGVNCRLYTRG